MKSQDLRKKLGPTYRPKYPVVDKMCSTCPFGKEEKFEALREELGLTDMEKAHALDIMTKTDVISAIESGREFMCHDTVFDKFNNPVAPQNQRKLCKGGVMYKKGEI